MSTAVKSILLPLCTAAALLPAATAVAQPKQPEGGAQVEPKAVPGERAFPRATPTAEAVKKFDPWRRKFSPSLARIKVTTEVVSRLPDRSKELVTEMDQGTYLGIVIDPLPLFAIPFSTANPSQFNPYLPKSGVPVDDANAPVTVRGPHYDAVLASGKRLRLVAFDSARSIGWTILRLEDGADPPAELRHVLVAPEAPRSMTEGEEFAAIAYRDILASDHVVTVPHRLQRGSEDFVRPALAGVSSALLGAPVFSFDGEWLGVVNHAPPGEKNEIPRIERPDVSKLTQANDPRAWSLGNRWPLLITTMELAPEIARLHALVAAPRDFSELGLSLADRDGAAVVESVRTGAFALDPLPQPGDRLVAVGETPVGTVRAFERALEAALASEGDSLTLRLERGAEQTSTTLRFPR